MFFFWGKLLRYKDTEMTGSFITTYSLEIYLAYTKKHLMYDKWDKICLWYTVKNFKSWLKWAEFITYEWIVHHVSMDFCYDQSSFYLNESEEKNTLRNKHILD